MKNLKRKLRYLTVSYVIKYDDMWGDIQTINIMPLRKNEIIPFILINFFESNNHDLHIISCEKHCNVFYITNDELIKIGHIEEQKNELLLDEQKQNEVSFEEFIL